MLNKRGSKKGQVTLFIIIAIVIVAVVILAFILVPRLFPKKVPVVTPADPEAYIGDCINLALEPLVETLASQGGYLEKPEHWIFYKDNYVGYLCYVNLYHQPCFNQQPFLKDFVEEQLETKLRNLNIVKTCVDNFADAATKQGYEVSTCDLPKFSVNLTEGKVNVPIKCEMTISKGEEVKRVEKIEPFLKWPLFEFVMLAKEIVEDEISYSDFEQLAYMMMHPWVSIDKFRADGTEIYILTEKATGKTFMFAVRNWVQSPGM